MIWLIEPYSTKRSKRRSLQRQPIPWLIRFEKLGEAIEAISHGEIPSLIFLAQAPRRSVATAVRRLQAAAPGAFIITLRAWGKDATVSACLRRLILASTMPVAPTSHPPGDIYKISHREREVLRCMVSGLIKKEIAEFLSLSYHTVDNHERHLFHKLNVHTRTAAVAKAVLEKLC
jgi:DNA-binding CsgD family transcriptional regulator